MKAASTTTGNGQLFSFSDQLARVIAVRLFYFQYRMAKAADRFINRLPTAYKRRLFIAAGLLFAAGLSSGIFNGSPIPAVQTKTAAAYHIGQASGMPGGKHPIIHPDTITTK